MKYEDAENVELAFDYLGGVPIDDREAFALAGRLKDSGRFSYARRVLDRLRKHTIRKRVSDPDFLHELREAHSLCTYKDKDIPAARRFDEALRLLESDGVVLEQSTRLETLGQAGSIFRRKWEQELESVDLQRACHYYRLAYQLALAHPAGNRLGLAWTGINFAYTLDLLAQRFAEESQEDQFAVFPYRRLQEKAQEVRNKLISELGEVTAEEREAFQQGKGTIDVRDLWWLLSVMGEAHYGLGDAWDEAERWFSYASELREGVQEWHLETTSRRIANLARMQETKTYTAGKFSRSRAGKVLRAYLGDERSEGVRSTFRGKVGLALSGGGFRASFFHLGVLARLAELDLLRHIEVISCVSGGSILGACYYLKLRRLLNTRNESELAPDDYLQVVEDLATDFFAGVRQNLRSSLVTDLRSNWRMVFDPGYTRTERAAELFESLLFSRVDPAPTASGPADRWRMQNLHIQPSGTENFHPRYNNWYRKYKVPMLILNASTLNTGHNWQFTGTWMGEPPGRIDGEIDANERLRRLYLNGAPGDYGDLNLGRAVAASACVPGLFEPMSFADLYDDRVVRLVDGGVFDNQGVGALLEEGCNVLLISDASGQMNNEQAPATGLFEVPLRTNAILMERVRQAQFMELAARRRAGLLRSLMFVHLTKDLDVLPVNWKGCREPADTAREAALQTGVEYLTPYRLHRDLQRKLAMMRTDLDSFTEVEAHCLMASGYQMTREYAPDLGTEAANDNGAEAEESAPVRDPAAPFHRDWRFLRVSPVLKQPVPDPELSRLLEVARFPILRHFRLRPEALKRVLASAALLLGALLLGGIGWSAWLLLPGSVSWGTLVAAGCLLMLAGLLLLAVRPIRNRLPGLAVDLALGTVGFVAARFQLRYFEPRLFRWGSLERFERRWRMEAGHREGAAADRLESEATTEAP